LSIGPELAEGLDDVGRLILIRSQPAIAGSSSNHHPIDNPSASSGPIISPKGVDVAQLTNF
jgi:hypothetical protein